MKINEDMKIKKSENKTNENKKMKKAVMREQLIPIIVIIVSAAIIIFFLMKFQFQKMSEKEACRQSVVLRANALIRGTEAISEGLIPLNCKTDYIEIKTSDEEAIKKEIADAMYECWYMLGEGRLNFIVGDPNKAYCLICSVISFSEETQKKVPVINDFITYLQTTIIPGKNITYLQYLASNLDPKLNVQQGIEDKIYTTQKQAIIFITGRTDNTINLVSRIGVSVGLGLTVAVFTGGAAIPILVGMTTDILLQFTQAITDEYTSSIILLPYDAQSISQVCQTIESIP